MINITMKLAANTFLMGHTQNDPTEEFQNNGITDDEQKEKFLDYLSDENGQFRISDFGLPHLEKLAKQLYLAKTPEQQLLITDKMLNIVHQRSDLASWYVEGGFQSLNELAGNPYNTTQYNKANTSSRFNWYKS